MRVDGKPTRTIWPAANEDRVMIIDQTRLPHEFVIDELATLGDFEVAIKDMKVRGAPLIGVTAAYGLAIALRDDPSDAGLAAASETLLATRPTAVNLAWALEVMRAALFGLPQPSAPPPPSPKPAKSPNSMSPSARRSAPAVSRSSPRSPRAKAA